MSPDDEWVQKGHFLDMEHVNPQFRPLNQRRFYYATAQRLTWYRPVKVGRTAGGSTNNTQVTALEPNSNWMIMQCAFGLRNHARVWVEHPTDHSRAQLPDRVPSDSFDTGIIRPDDSPYYDPNLSQTEFWIVRELADSPTFHAEVPSNLGPMNPTLSILANMIVLKPVDTEDVERRLRNRQLRSTPVDFKVTDEFAKAVADQVTAGGS